METVNVHAAKTTLSRLLKRGRPQPGAFKGKVVLPDSFFDPLPEEELKAWEGDCDCEFCSTPPR